MKTVLGFCLVLMLVVVFPQLASAVTDSLIIYGDQYYLISGPWHWGTWCAIPGHQSPYLDWSTGTAYYQGSTTGLASASQATVGVYFNNHANTGGWVSLWNWNTSSWVTKATLPIISNYVSINVSPICDYVQGGAIKIRAESGWDNGTEYCWFHVVYNNTTPQTGTISATSTPTGTSVYLDGTYKGTTPTSFAASPGSHTVRFSQSCYADCSQSVTVTSCQTTNVSCTLTPQNGTINATSTPSGASVYLDGVYKGVTPLPSLTATPGSHTVRFSLSCYLDCTQSVTVICNQTTNAYCSLTPQDGTISANSSPSGASVYLDGAYKGVTPTSFNSAPGSHTVRFSMSCYNDCNQSVTVISCQTTNVSCSLAPNPNGTISTTSIPSGASAYLDGAYQGVTPIAFAASAGSHTVRFSQSCYTDCSQSATVICGQTTNVSCTLTPQNGTIYATSTPSGASVYLDGAYQGVTPGTFAASPGTHTVKFTMLCYDDCTQPVTVVCGQTSNVSCILTPNNNGTISATSTPSGAGVYLDGLYKGITPISFAASAGSHSVRFSLSCYDDCTQSVTVTCGQTSNVGCTLVLNNNGTVSATSTPSGASVYLDGVYKGITPASFSAPSGPHSVRFSQLCYDDCTQSITVLSCQTTNVSCTLTPQNGTIDATSTPTGASVYLDGVYKGVTPLPGLTAAPGSHTVRFSLSCYNDCNQSVTVICNQTANVSCTLTPQDGTIIANSTPGGASVYLDGVLRGTTPVSLAISPGPHTVRFSMPCYDDCTQPVTVACGQTTNVSCTLIPNNNGTISATTTPSGADVYLDGLYKGTTPTSFAASSGSHLVRFSKLGYQDCTKSVTVTCGQTSDVSCILPPISPQISVSPASFEFTVVQNGLATGVVRISNVAAAGAQDLSWQIDVQAATVAIAENSNPDGTQPPVYPEADPSASVANVSGQTIQDGIRVAQLYNPHADEPQDTWLSGMAGTVLYDQTDFGNVGGAASQNFEAVNNSFDHQGADDFVIPGADGAWTIESILVPGFYETAGLGPARSVNVWFYADAGGLPGSAVSSTINLVPSDGVASGSFVLSLNPPVVLPAGTYWLSAQANQDFSTYGQWYWDLRSTLWNHPAAWRNPGNGSGKGCTAWSTMASSCVGGAFPDLGFQLRGTKGITGCSWLAATPPVGVVAPGTFADVQVTINAAGLTSGSYVCHLAIASNDPDPNDNPKVIPVTMTVISPANSVVVQSKNVISSTKEIPIGIFLTNDVAIKNFVIPLEIRSTSGGAFITRMKRSFPSGTRLDGKLTDINIANWYDGDTVGTCKQGLPGGYKGIINQTQNAFFPVTSSPEAVFFTRGRIFNPALPAGTDSSKPEILLTVDMNNNSGTFEIDTTCTNPANHLIFADDATNAKIIPVFHKGVITVLACLCPNQGDIWSPGVLDVFDVIGVIGIAFSGESDPQDAACPRTRGDVNSDGVTDVFDVIYLIDHVFRGGPAPVDPCSP